MKRNLIFCGLILLLVAGVFIWRARHPRLTDAEQIAANLNAIVAAANARDAASVADYMAPKFAFNDQGQSARREFQRQLYAGMLQYRVVDLQVSGVENRLNGETATSDGRFSLNLKRDFNSPPEPHTGGFKLRWNKMDGKWKIIAVEGAPVPE